MEKIYFIIFIIIALIIAGGIYYIIKNWIPNGQELPETPPKEISREEIIKDVCERINDISPVNPVLGGKWYVLRFWFIQDSNKNFYTEYEDGHIMSKILAEAEKINEELTYKIFGVFEPGEVDWQLKQGEDKTSLLKSSNDG